jgi:hypothetical protein
LIGENKLDEASRLLETIDAKAVAQLAGVPDWSANLDLSRAEIAYRRGDYPTARKTIQPAIAVFSRPNAEAYQKRKAERLLLSLDGPVRASR